MRRWILGLTGGIGSGKSAAAAQFARHGAALVDTDLIAHQLTAPGGQAIPFLVEAFGADILTSEGAMDRAAMRRRVFEDPKERGRLEAILHPMIRAESQRQCEAAEAPYVVLVVPLLVESGSYRERCDRVCVVDCPEAVQVERVMARNGLAPAEVRRILAAQASREARLAAADDVIDNGGDLAALGTQIKALHRRYLELAAGRQG